MASNSLGTVFKVTSFGESHGPTIGVVIDGCKAGIQFNESFISRQLQRRRPGQSALTTSRNEDENFSVISGVFEGKTTGAPICILIPNTDARPEAYDALKNIFRPSHADYTYYTKYGVRDHRGGGRSSARVTAGWVAAGAFAQSILAEKGITVQAYVSQVGSIKVARPYSELNLSETDTSPVRCPDKEAASAMEKYIEQLKSQGNSTGGMVSCVIKNCPAGLGEPLFDKLQANLAKAMFSINAVKGFDYGSGFESVGMTGGQHNDEYVLDGSKITTRTNFSGGIQGGISTGNDIYMRVAFKPVATIAAAQRSLNTEREEVTIEAKGRHDPCVVPRAVPIVESMAALVIYDHLLIAGG
jgi:chorismate synthase